MSDKTTRILAIAGLVTMAVFVVTLILSLFDPAMGNHSVSIIALCSGAVSLVLFFLVRRETKRREQTEAALKSMQELPGEGDMDAEHADGASQDPKSRSLPDEAPEKEPPHVSVSQTPRAKPEHLSQEADIADKPEGQGPAGA